MAESDKLLSSAKAALQAGRKQTARRLLSGIVAAEPANEQAWLYLAAASSHGEAVEALGQILALNPDHSHARQQLQRLTADPSALVMLESEVLATSAVAASASEKPKPTPRARKPRTPKPKLPTAAADSEVEATPLPETLLYAAQPVSPEISPTETPTLPEVITENAIKAADFDVAETATKPPFVSDDPTPPVQTEAAIIPPAAEVLEPEPPLITDAEAELTTSQPEPMLSDPIEVEPDLLESSASEKLAAPFGYDITPPRPTLPIQAPALVTFKLVETPTATSGTRNLPNTPAPFRSRTRLKSRPVRRNGRLRSRTNLTGFGLLLALLVLALVGYLVYISFF